MQSKARFLLSLFIAFQSFAVFAHGGDKPGPNGGHIKMPGAFHTELVLQPKKDSLQIFLLDISFKNPVVADSKVEVIYKNGSSTEALECKTSKSYFECTLKNLAEKTSGELIVTASRLGAVAKPAVYTLPLTFEMNQP